MITTSFNLGIRLSIMMHHNVDTIMLKLISREDFAVSSKIQFRHHPVPLKSVMIRIRLAPNLSQMIDARIKID